MWLASPSSNNSNNVCNVNGNNANLNNNNYNNTNGAGPLDSLKNVDIFTKVKYENLQRNKPNPLTRYTWSRYVLHLAIKQK